MIVYPNAKINIGLNVLRKRADGYHDISSVFYPVKELFDVLEIVPANTPSFVSSGIFIPGEENICMQAFYLLKADFGISDVKMHLHKQIPIGAGLGGGSSDGAFTLILLNDLFNLNLSNKRLKEYALELGADCPFFIENTPQYINGLGDKMTPIKLDLSDFSLKFYFSELHISTVDAYNGIELKSSSVALLDLIKTPLERWKGNVLNDFETSIFAKHPKLKMTKEELYADGAIYVSMSGSGSAIYAIFIK